MACSMVNFYYYNNFCGKYCTVFGRTFSEPLCYAVFVFQTHVQTLPVSASRYSRCSQQATWLLAVRFHCWRWQGLLYRALLWTATAFSQQMHQGFISSNPNASQQPKQLFVCWSYKPAECDRLYRYVGVTHWRIRTLQRRTISKLIHFLSWFT